MNDNSKKIILDLCGGTGSWGRPYKEAGYDYRLVTLPDNDVRNYQPPENVYGILAAPPCTEFTAFCLSRHREYSAAIEVVNACLRIIHEALIWHYEKTGKYNGGLGGLKFWALENPGGKGTLKNFLGKPAFVFNPCDFGDQYKKETNLWGIFNKPKPLAVAMFGITPAYIRVTIGRDGMTRQEVRAITPPGFARAFYEANK
jgi:hypothetical protein